MKKLLSLTILFVAVLAVSACVPKETIVMGEGNWDSNAFHDQVAKIIIEEGYGKTVEVVTADTAIMVSGLIAQDINIAMELWSDNVVTYDEDIAEGRYVYMSTNFDDNQQGLYIPAYLQEAYPDLVTVEDLKDYANLFPNPEGGDKGIIYGGPEGWSATAFLNLKMSAYELDTLFDFQKIDSSATLDATLVSAYANEEPWVGYYWEPTWIMGQYDMVLLEDSEYTDEDFDLGVGAFPTVDVNVVVDSEFEATHPEVAEFLSNYETSSAITSAALGYMQENDLEPFDAAVWFLQENTDLWSAWVTQDAYDSIMAFLDTL
jgi:glycine betaine/proline transport system substrate-binding protein